MKYIVYSLLNEFCRNKKAPLIIVSEEKKKLNIYLLNPEMPKKDDFQKYIELYLVKAVLLLVFEARISKR